MTIYVSWCQLDKRAEIVIKCRKLLRFPLSQIVVTFFAVPFPPSLFGFRRCVNDYVSWFAQNHTSCGAMEALKY